jgi:NADH-quinone oxidoreductase subunit G
MATIYIDNRPYEVDPDQNLLHECLSLGFDLPYFCWHPAMGSVGACRQCAVKQFKDEKDTRGKIVMACMTPAADGTRISIDDPEAKAFRKSVIEWLMLNHPHDCPVCDEGGECHLQDMTVMTGHDYRRTRFKKRTHRNQNLGPFINHEMNRCIQCYRCVRFYRDFAGGRDLDVFACHGDVYFGRYEPGVLENEFSGNLVEVCPTGVFTDKTLGKHYVRKWDLQDAPSICVHCGLGCNTSPRARSGMLRRIVNRYHVEINNYFICDRGRFGYEFVNSGQRIRRIRSTGKADSRPAVLEEVKSVLNRGGDVIGIGSPRASLEANFALRKLVGAENFFNGMSGRENNLVCAAMQILQKSPVAPASIQDVERSDAVFILGEDLLNTSPRLAFAVRQSIRQKPMEIADKLKIPRWHEYAVRTAVQDEKGPLAIATPYSTNLDDIAAVSWRAAPADIARLGFAVASVLDPQAPRVAGPGDELKKAAETIAQALAAARRPVVLSGTSCAALEVIEAAANVALALHQAGKGQAKICFTVPECNSAGVAMVGRESLDDALERAEAGVDTILVLENDLYRRAPATEIDRLFASASIIVLDSLENETAAKANVLLPSVTFAESEGTLINNEGRAQRFFKVMPADGEIQESWRWLRDIMVAAGLIEPDAWVNLDDVIQALQSEIPELQRISEAAPPASFRIVHQKIPRQLHRYSGRTAITANISVHEPAPPSDPDSPLSFSMEGYQGQSPTGLASFFWAPGWNSYQAVNRFQSEIGGALRGGPAGVKLFEQNGRDGISYFTAIPEAFARRGDDFLILPAYHIFGSEELSARSPGIGERATALYAGLNPADAGDLNISAGQQIEIAVGGISRRLLARLVPSLPRGTAVLPSGFPGLEGISLPLWGKIKPM